MVAAPGSQIGGLTEIADRTGMIPPYLPAVTSPSAPPGQARR